MIRLGHAPGSAAETDWHETVGRAVLDTLASTYVVLWEDTLDLVSPMAPIPGAVGVVGDVRRIDPRLTAWRSHEYTPEAVQARHDIRERLARLDALDAERRAQRLAGVTS